MAVSKTAAEERRMNGGEPPGNVLHTLPAVSGQTTVERTGKKNRRRFLLEILPTV